MGWEQVQGLSGRYVLLWAFEGAALLMGEGRWGDHSNHRCWTVRQDVHPSI